MFYGIFRNSDFSPLFSPNDTFINPPCLFLLMKPQLNAIYVAVKDMDRAVKFYEDIFDIKVSSKDERMSLFDFGNINFLLYNPQTDSETISVGNNVVPAVQVEDVSKMFELLKNKNCEIVLPLEKVGDYYLFQARDTEDNIIEFYQVLNWFVGFIFHKPANALELHCLF